MSGIIKPCIDRVPAALASLNQWVVWKAEEKKNKPGKLTKVPYNPKSHRQASSTKRKHWGTFNQACDAYLIHGGYDGIGFVFTADDDLIGIDLDDCFGKDGVLNDEGQEVISLIDSYAERSVSGTGLHVIGRGQLPGAGHCDKKRGREIYQEGRFFTITADILNGKDQVQDRTTEIRDLYEQWFGVSSVERYIATDFEFDKSAPLVTLDDLPVDDYTRNLIRNGENCDDFKNEDGAVDRSTALFFAARQMVYCGANKETILTILTDDSYFLGSAATDRRGSNRQSAMEWVWKYTVAKLFKQYDEEKNLFDNFEESENDDEIVDDVTSTTKEGDEDDTEGTGYVKGSFNRNALIYLQQETPIVREEQQFFKYNNKYWEKVDDEKFESDVHIALSKGNGSKGMSMSQINNTIKAIKRFATRKHFKLSPTKICFKNGVLDLNGWDLGLVDYELLPHSAKHWVLNSLSFDYDPGATCETWLSFLDDVFEYDHERIKLLQQWFGYNLVYDYRFQKMLICAGESRSGKGTVANMLKLIVGAQNYVGTSLKSFTTDFGLQNMLHVKSVVVPDAIQVEKAKINAVREALLNITSNDTISVNRKYKDSVIGQIPARITLMANQVPRFADEYDALFNRYMVLPFRVSFAGREDVRLSNKLEAEVAGVFNWAVEGLLDLASKGFIEPAMSLEEARELRELANPVKTFIEKFMIPTGDDDDVIPCAEVYDLYRRYCEQIDMKPVYVTQFGKRMNKSLPMVKSVPRRINGGTSNPVKLYLGLTVNSEMLSEFIHIEF